MSINLDQNMKESNNVIILALAETREITRRISKWEKVQLWVDNPDLKFFKKSRKEKKMVGEIPNN